MVVSKGAGSIPRKKVRNRASPFLRLDLIYPSSRSYFRSHLVCFRDHVRAKPPDTRLMQETRNAVFTGKGGFLQVPDSLRAFGSVEPGPPIR